MRLTALNAKFLNSVDGHAVAVLMDCPCGDREPNHRLYVPFDVERDGWARTGDTIDTLTLSPSVQRLEACRWHGWIRNGEAVTC